MEPNGHTPAGVVTDIEPQSYFDQDGNEWAKGVKPTAILEIKTNGITMRIAEMGSGPLVILVHGWPGSVYEFHRIVPMLTEPEKFGGRAEDAFHIVAPSLIGFGFSGKPTEPGWSSQRMAEVFIKLMTRLGHTRYGAQGGDWGGGIVRTIAGGDGGHCVGAHSNFPGGNRPTDGSDGGATAAELERMQKRNQELADQ